MPFYRFTALTRSGATQHGEEAAESRAALTAELQRRGLFVRRVQRKFDVGRALSSPRVRDRDVLLLVQELTSLLRAGLAVTEALEAAVNRPGAPAIQRVLARILEDIRGGMSLSAAGAHHPEVFSPLLVAALRTGERTGDLVPVFERYQEHLRRRIEIHRKVIQALTYPALLLLLLIAVLGILFTFVIPRFVTLYADMNTELPLPTRVLMSAVEQGPIIGAAFVVLALGLWALGRALRATERGRYRLDEVRLSLPILGTIFRLQECAYIARTLETLLGAGMTVVDAIRTATDGTRSRVYSARLNEVSSGLQNGLPLARAVTDARVFPPLMTRLIASGESSGDLQRPLSEVASYCEERMDDRVARLAALSEPVMMLVMGVFVGGIIIVTYLPIFSMAEVIH